MNRVDTKYILPASILPEVLVSLRPHYAVLSINNHRIFTYQNIYFDTSGLLFCHMHHNGVRKRYKVRCRRYVDTGSTYLEVKIKTNKNKTHKVRKKNVGEYSPDSLLKEFARQHLPATVGDLFPSLWINFQRITLVDETSAERLTLDSQISYRTSPEDKPNPLVPLVIAEHKKYRECKPASPFPRLMRRLRIQPGSFSKYFVGCSLLYSNQIKTNRFKPIFLELQRIQKRSNSCHDDHPDRSFHSTPGH